jgi:hypothetical protein
MGRRIPPLPLIGRGGWAKSHVVSAMVQVTLPSFVERASTEIRLLSKGVARSWIYLGAETDRCRIVDELARWHLRKKQASPDYHL